MAITKVLARDWTFEVKNASNVYIPIKGVNTFSLSPSANKAETTDFDSNGWAENMVASRGLSLKLSGFHLEDVQDGTRDPGQERVELLSTLVGPASVGQFRMTSPGGKVKEFSATANVTAPGGGNDDAASWEVEIEVTGAPIDSTALLVSITVIPDPPSVKNGGAIQLQAIGIYSNGSSREITSLVTWSSGTPATATIAANGVATSVSVGTSVITAAMSGKTDTATLTVTA
jgi:hypothetical protein